MTLRDDLIFSGIPAETVDAFLAYHAGNRDIWTAFKRIALRLISAGVKHYGAKAIFEVIRYERLMQGEDGFNANNNFAAYYARSFALEFPKYAGFFEFREVRGLKQAA